MKVFQGELQKVVQEIFLSMPPEAEEIVIFTCPERIKPIKRLLVTQKKGDDDFKQKWRVKPLENKTHFSRTTLTILDADVLKNICVQEENSINCHGIFIVKVRATLTNHFVNNVVQKGMWIFFALFIIAIFWEEMLSK